MSADGSRAQLKERQRLVRDRIGQQPPLAESVRLDTHVVSFHRGEFFDTATASTAYIAWRAFRLMWVSDAFFAQFVYRLRMWLKVRRVPFLPRLLHKVAMMTSQLSIDEMVIIEPGVNVAHGQAIIGGLTEIGHGCTISPWVSIGLQPGNLNGPKIGNNVFIGTGAKVLGDLVVGDGAVIGSQALVTRDVPAGATVAGIPAKVIGYE